MSASKGQSSSERCQSLLKLASSVEALVDDQSVEVIDRVVTALESGHESGDIHDNHRSYSAVWSLLHEDYFSAAEKDPEHQDPDGAMKKLSKRVSDIIDESASRNPNREARVYGAPQFNKKDRSVELYQKADDANELDAPETTPAGDVESAKHRISTAIEKIRRNSERKSQSSNAGAGSASV